MSFVQTPTTPVNQMVKPWFGFFGLIVEDLYRLVVVLRLWLYRRGMLKTHQVSVPVVSVGNVTTGGTGKTPVVIAMAQYLESKGVRVVVLSRGYKSRVNTRFHQAVGPEYGDEPYLIQQQLTEGKVFVGKDRVYTATKAIEQCQPDVILLDDGFQHVRLHRDVNIVLVDGEERFGNGHLLPAGPLREPLDAIYRADWVLLTKQPTAIDVEELQDTVNHLEAPQEVRVASCPFEPTSLFHPETQETLSIEEFKGNPLFLVSGIARPQSFERMVRSTLSKTVVGHRQVADHYHYTASDMAHIASLLEEHPEAFVVTTEKDWVKWQALLVPFLPRVYVLSIAPVFEWGTILAPILPQLAQEASHV